MIARIRAGLALGPERDRHVAIACGAGNPVSEGRRRINAEAAMARRERRPRLVDAGTGGVLDPSGSSAEESAGPTGSARWIVAPAGFKACQVTDTGGVDDKGFNQNAHDGVLRAESELGVTSALLESTADTDYAPNLATFTRRRAAT